MVPLNFPAKLAKLLVVESVTLAQGLARAYRRERRRRRPRQTVGATLRPGQHTPLWNELRRQLQPHLRKYGQQVKLGRLVGLPRQRINAYVTRGTQMPDAERTLQLTAWLLATRQGRPPS